ncbi:hypothetical protein ASC95_08950 [Pelomonas sp. Root1217]|uniref:hypothetical protein n=1 Tax=Pelomonas sp. Root1217 TaxID=1736430 RepID=UPI00070B758B|nr:hypothetical protein [Pelomonas sp. Root1217]KQV52910.1 hypothetical protein ASC95_08950 [Pelomonas sp. Root1217]
MTKDFLVQTRSLYAAIFDEASPVNRSGFLTEMLADAGRMAREQGREDFERLFIFNDALMSLTRQGQLLPWTLLFDGVYRVAVEMGEVEPLAALADVGSPTTSVDLVCPSGRLVIACLSTLGEAHQPFIEVRPGVHRVMLERDEEQEFHHMLLDTPAAYPADEGPDWRVVVDSQ